MQVQLMNTHLQPHQSPVTRRTNAHISTSPSIGGAEKHSVSAPTAQRTPLRLAANMATASTASAITAVASKPLGPIEMIRSVVRTHGLKGLWVGHSGMMVLETVGAAGWFTVKEIVGRQLKQMRAGREEEARLRGDDIIVEVRTGRKYEEDSMGLLPWESAVAGAAAGAACVLALYPIDTVKSAMQTEEDIKKAANRGSSTSPVGKGSSFTRVLKQMYSAHGVRGLYSGCGMTVARVVPSSGIVFMVYDSLSNWLD
ncbi:hypothetical protein AX16_007670 [Volvariella volvacea WC 439]|nr:hypothetical protein AX16_007670 [Volvariella volvacea WC 439]